MHGRFLDKEGQRCIQGGEHMGTEAIRALTADGGSLLFPSASRQVSAETSASVPCGTHSLHTQKSSLYMHAHPIWALPVMHKSHCTAHHLSRSKTHMFNRQFCQFKRIIWNELKKLKNGTHLLVRERGNRAQQELLMKLLIFQNFMNLPPNYIRLEELL